MSTANAFSAVLGAGRGPFSEDTLLARAPSERARQDFDELLAAGWDGIELVCDRLARHADLVDERPLLGRLATWAAEQVMQQAWQRAAPRAQAAIALLDIPAIDAFSRHTPLDEVQAEAVRRYGRLLDQTRRADPQPLLARLNADADLVCAEAIPPALAVVLANARASAAYARQDPHRPEGSEPLSTLQQLAADSGTDPVQLRRAVERFAGVRATAVTRIVWGDLEDPPGAAGKFADYLLGLWHAELDKRRAVSAAKAKAANDFFRAECDRVARVFEQLPADATSAQTLRALACDGFTEADERAEAQLETARALT